MKIILGVISSLIILTAAVLGILVLWGFPVTWVLIYKISITFSIVTIAFALLALVIIWFFKKEKYRKESGNQAHPINQHEQTFDIQKDSLCCNNSHYNCFRSCFTQIRLLSARFCSEICRRYFVGCNGLFRITHFSPVFVDY